MVGIGVGVGVSGNGVLKIVSDIAKISTAEVFMLLGGFATGIDGVTWPQLARKTRTAAINGEILFEIIFFLIKGPFLLDYPTIHIRIGLFYH
jgi:hypothetical protein